MISLDEPVVVGTSLGKQMHVLATELYPICRSITGNGVRQTLGHPQTENPARNLRGSIRDEDL